MLFIDHHHAEAVESNPLLNQCVSANNDVNSSARQVTQHLPTFFTRHTTCQQLHTQWPITKKILRIGHLQIFDKLLNSDKMLFGKHFGRRHDCTLVLPLHRSEHGRDCNNCLSATDIALQ